MRAIIIEEDRFPEVVDAMRLRALQIREGQIMLSSETRKVLEAIGSDAQKALLTQLADDIFRSMNFEFVRWAQSHGASCVKS